MPDTLLKLDDIACRYDALLAVDGVSLALRRGEIGCLLGPSGCGKTTVLRVVAGFEPLARGAVRLEGREIATPAGGLPPDQRGVGMVFQDYALFPHLRAVENVAFGLREGSRRDRRRTAAALLDLVGLGGMAERYPHELSGGQQQRVALARALAPRPRLVLFDEPFSNLDVDLRERLGLDVRRLLKAQGIAAVFVTHDQHEAFLLGDRIGVMREGRLLQWDSAFALYHQPADRFVADFVGQGRLVPGLLRAPDTVETPLGLIRGNVAYHWAPGSRVDLLLRPDDVVPDPAGPVEGEVVARAFKGAETLYTLRLADGTEVLCEVPSRLDHPVGASLRVRADVDHLIAFPH
ncbi:MAG: ABC transporter ATP-binding protein [Gammaproteobacteria bacterium]|jgi:iron(III) transport system ATP-binding protein|nr:ABC transporter ATP-binding protein [Gammaproteobacteria bacterium]